jgi:predicted adenine nucleotide alpha hydrolase (AANH) superfamily ATPase
MELKNNNKILLHACCGICSGYPIIALKEQGYEVTVFFCNPNLDSKEEFERRLNAQKEICKHFNVNLIVEEYDHDSYLNYIKGLENEPERGKRCEKCIELRLELAGKKAKELGFDLFTTSLVISPHKNFDMISKIGENIASELSINYLSQNFRKQDGFLKTNLISRKLGIYRQNYCGCEFAKRAK